MENETPNKKLTSSLNEFITPVIKDWVDKMQLDIENQVDFFLWQKACEKIEIAQEKKD